MSLAFHLCFHSIPVSLGNGSELHKCDERGGESAMTHIRQDKKSGNFFIRFRYAGSSFNRSLRTKFRREASAVRGRVEETILLLERGRIEMPHSADPAEFILSDGKRLGKPVKPKIRTLYDLFRVYNA